jgi:hypothetical protein
MHYKEKKFVKEDLLKVLNIFLFLLFFHFRRGGKEERRKIHECTYIYISCKYPRLVLLQFVSVLG